MKGSLPKTPGNVNTHPKKQEISTYSFSNSQDTFDEVMKKMEGLTDKFERTIYKILIVQK